VRLLLDEMFSPQLARALRERGHDVVAVGERADLSGPPDAEVLTAATSEKRAMLTEDVADYAALAREYARRGESHHGIVLTSAARFTRRRAGLGRLVRALDAFLSEQPATDALRDETRWLERD
jgi:predicted nuclease of predicted toxin-antitoxin system